MVGRLQGDQFTNSAMTRTSRKSWGSCRRRLRHAPSPDLVSHRSRRRVVVLDCRFARYRQWMAGHPFAGQL